MSTPKATIKNAVLRTARTAGFYRRAAESEKRSNSLLILCYHGISLRDEHEWAGDLFITPERFRSRLAILRDMRANVLSLQEGLTRLLSGNLPPLSVAITFDDGFVDFHRHAVPIVTEFGFPCTLYLTTYYSARPYPIVNLILNYLIWKSKRASIALPEIAGGQPQPVASLLQRIEAVKKIIAWFDAQQFDTAAKNEYAASVAAQLGIDYNDILKSRILQIMTPDEAAEASRAGIDLQLHTHRHRTPRNRDLFLREIHDNRSHIEAITGRPATDFCYPSGVYASDFLPWLREAGVQSGTTCERGFARLEHDPLLLPRLLDDSNMDAVQFEAYISGFLTR